MNLMSLSHTKKLATGKRIGGAFGSKLTSNSRTMNKNANEPKIKRQFQRKLLAHETG